LFFQEESGKLLIIMPSYYLLCNANLGDLQYSDVSRKYLQIGNFDSVYADDVDITDGAIRAQHIQLKSLDNNVYNNFLRCRIINDDNSNQVNELYWQDDYLRWIFEDTINLSSFSNINHYANQSMFTTNFPYTGNMAELINLPKKDATIPNDYDIEGNLFSTSSNLSELRGQLQLDISTPTESFQKINSIFNNTLGNLSYEPENLPKVNIVHVEEFKLLSNVVVDGYLYSSGIINTDELMDRNTIIWYDPFLNEDGSLRDSFKLVENFLANNTDMSSVKISNLEVFQSSLLNRINKSQNNLDIDRVRDRITNLVVEGDTYLVTSNLLTDINDIESVHNLLSIGSVAFEDNRNAQLEVIDIEEKLVYKNFDDDEFNNPKYFISDSEGYLSLERLPTASLEEFGTVLLFDSFEHMHLDYYSHEVPTINFMNYFKADVKENITNVYNSLRFFFKELEEPPDGILDSNLTGYSNLSAQTLEDIGVYHNLEIPKVCYTGSFTDIYHTPKNITNFRNDITALSKRSLFSGEDQLNTLTVMDNLDLSTMCFQNHDDVNIINGSAILEEINPSEITIVSSLYTDISDYLLAYNNETETVQWSPIQIANETKFGLVKVSSSYLIDSRESVVPGTYILEMKSVLETKLNRIEKLLDQLEASL
jgi:hypothetical protein